MTAFANSHLTVLKQSTAAIISTVRIYGNLLSQIIRMLFLFLYIENFNFRYHSAFLWINYFSYSQILIELFFLSGSYHLCGATTPRRRFTAFGRCPERPSRLWGSGTVARKSSYKKLWTDKACIRYSGSQQGFRDCDCASGGCGASVWAPASYAEQSLISAREQPENEACSRISDVCLYHNPSFSSRIFFISSASSLYFPVT